MANLKGIRVSFETSAKWWSPTADALFLGVYGPGGGREFRLNGDIPINQPDKAFSLVLGDPCCPTPNDVPVQYSTGMGDNDPLLNPVELDRIDHVYVRKETADSTSANDDVLALQGANVLLCDTEGRLGLWRRDALLNFSDEAGLQQWLGQIDPPTCHISIRLTRVRHQPSGAHSAGRNWIFSFSAGSNDDYEQLLPPYSYGASTYKDWDLAFDRTKHIAVVGCCGHPQTVVLHGYAYERDWWSPDETSMDQYHVVACEKGTVSQSGSLDVVVQGWQNHQSTISFDYDLSCSCGD
ncbi:MAG: hypothetical protein QOH71_1737 [Blastocatellia bacterium]|jgi:hypothetical protein|nr:hypothetical protein [Blastocatellia bacterium]